MNLEEIPLDIDPPQDTLSDPVDIIVPEFYECDDDYEVFEVLEDDDGF